MMQQGMGHITSGRAATRPMLHHSLPHQQSVLLGPMPAACSRPAAAGSAARTPAQRLPHRQAVVAHATEEKELGVSGGFLESGAQQSQAFGVLAVTSAGLGLTAFLAPELLLSLAYPGDGLMGDPVYGALDGYYLRIAGATLALSAAVEYSLMDAAAAGRLRSTTYQRLMLGSIAKSVGYLAVWGACSQAWTPVVSAVYPLAAAASIGLNAAVLAAVNKPHGGSPPDLSLPLVPTTTEGWLYYLISGTYLATALLCVIPGGPSLFFEASTAGGFQDLPSSVLLRSTWAPGFLMASVAALNLRDAADRGRLGASTFKRLNLGIIAMELAYCAVFGWSMLTRTSAADFVGLTNLAAALAISSYCTWHWLWARKK